MIGMSPEEPNVQEVNRASSIDCMDEDELYTHIREEDYYDKLIKECWGKGADKHGVYNENK